MPAAIPGSGLPHPPAAAGYLRPRHHPWADLLRRTFGIDILAWPQCGGRLQLLATIADPAVIARILAHLGLPLEPPHPDPARSPPWLPSLLPGLASGDGQSFD